MTLNVEDDVAGFFGVHIDHTYDGCITLTQTGIIDHIMLATHLEDANPKKIPSPKEPLSRDLHGSPFSQELNYASIFCVLMYLYNNICPVILCEVS